ncbi:SpoIID/LytB domain-containing protein [Candidatus Babeliales bacterium]|nr:SpoIID/LytB domain-containing protein [Candidatus Babeliales bacterium]
MARINFFVLFLLICCTLTIKTFDVKVLLQKKSIQDFEKNNLELISKHGFVFSAHPNLAIGYQYLGKTITISGKHDIILLNAKPLKEKLVYISPILSAVQLATLKSYVSCWFESKRVDLEDEVKKIYELFDLFVVSDKLDPLRYNQLYEFSLQIFQGFLEDFIDGVDQPSVTLETLQFYAQEFLNDRIKFLFLEQIAALNFSKEDRKKLEKDKKYRYKLLGDILFDVTQKLLHEFVPVLPSKLLQQILEQDASGIEFQGNQYLGSFVLFQEKNQLYVINSLDIDDYLLSVIKHEGWPGWPLEMNKVLAIACRTYLIWQVLQAQKINRPYHIENGIKHQTYKGHHNQSLKFKQAVQETKDMFVSYDEKPALTMYDACCGGIVPAHIDDPDYKRVSYLAREYPCTFCKNYKVFNWHVDFSSETIITRLQKDFPKVTKLIDMIVLKKDKAGLVKKIQFNVGTRKIIITDKKMKSLFPELKSYCFNITRAHRHYLIEGKGFGHHRGLCQWGAYKLVKDDHWNFTQVLQFYYPGTKLMKLMYQR